MAATKTPQKKLGEMRNCEWCSKPFYASRSKIKAGEGRFCSRPCVGRIATRKHGHNGLIRNPTYSSWAGMIQRTTNPNNAVWWRYGGRGIGVIERWRKYENFLADMGEKPAGMELERRDNNKGYEPSNCYWETHSNQMRNTSRTVFLTVGDRTMCLTDWQNEIGISDSTLQYRLGQCLDNFAVLIPTPIRRPHGRTKA